MSVPNSNSWKQGWAGKIIKPGDTLIFSASGYWDMGLGGGGPEGQEKPCECPVLSYDDVGPVGALIGQIGDGKPFFIGSSRKIIALEGGQLYLGANDNMGPCDGVSRGSCYADNRGQVTVTLEIRSPADPVSGKK